MGTKIVLTKEQILKGIVSPFVTILAFTLSFIKDKALVAEIVNETASQVNALQEGVETPPTMQEAIEAVLDIAETAAEATPTEVDDAVIQTAKGLFTGGGLIAAFQGLIGLGKAKRADKKAAAEESADIAPADAPAE